MVFLLNYFLLATWYHHLSFIIVYNKYRGTLPREPMPSNITVRLPTLEDLDAYALEQWEVAFFIILK